MNNHGKIATKELLFILSQLIGTVLMWIFAFYPIAIAFTIWGILFILQEYLWDKKTDKTISQHFWTRGKVQKIGAVLICLAMAIQFGSLIVHLIVPVFSR